MTDRAAASERASEDEARRFAADVRAVLEWVDFVSNSSVRNEVAVLVRTVLGADGVRQSIVRRDLPPLEHVNLQTALNEWCAAPGRTVDVHGITVPPHYPGVSLQQLVGVEALPPIALSAPGMLDLPNGPASTLACFRLALLVVTDAAGRYVLQVRGPSEHDPELVVEVGGLPVAEAQAVLSALDRLRFERNVYRGHLLDVAQTPMGGVALNFAPIPEVGRDDVVLPEAVLGRVERHALSVAAHRAALLSAGQHLKRGLLLFGPPGTGKTHTVRYLLARMTGYTRLVMTGRSLGAVGAVAELARDLQPAVVVLEDVDLVAAERTFSPSGSPVLFDLLDAMDGAAPDADVLFLLTTNRSDLLEPALAARPGRVDVAVEIDLPDAAARSRLLALYSRDVPLQLSDAELAATIERTDGVTASFIKELLRRAVLEALREQDALSVVTGGHLVRALDDLLDSTQSVTRTLLGVGVDPESLAAGGGVGAMPGVAPMGMRMMRRGHGSGWVSYFPRP